MLSQDALTFIDKLFRLIRNSDAPFGGVQMILVGDFHQVRLRHLSLARSINIPANSLPPSYLLCEHARASRARRGSQPTFGRPTL